MGNAVIKETNRIILCIIGYRLHTPTEINPSTGHPLPLVSIVGAANRRDILFLNPLIKLAQALG
jgi:hypothetical protein